MKTRQFMLMLFLVIITHFKCLSNETGHLMLSQDSLSYDLRSYCKIIETATDSIQVLHLLSGKVNNWQTIRETTSNRTYWGNVSLNNSDSIDLNYVLEFGLNSYIDLYIVSKGLVINHQQSGELVATRLKTLNYNRRSCVFRLTIPARSVIDIYFKVRNVLQEAPVINPKITSSYRWHQKARYEWSTQWLYHGFLWAFIICALAVFIIEKERIYLYFFTYAFSLSFYLAWYAGIFQVLIIPDYPLLNSYFMLVGGIIPVCYMLFVKSLVTSSNNDIQLERVIQIAIQISMLIAVSMILVYIITFDRKLTLQILYNSIIAQAIFGMYLLVKLYLTGQFINRLLVLGSFIFMVTAISALISEYYFYQPGALYYVQLGSILELIVFSIAIGYRIKRMNWKRKKTHALAVLQFEKNEVLQKEINNQLGETITLKEQELEKKNIILKNAVNELQITNKELSDFAYVVSHDLKAPLRGISTLAKFLTEDHNDDLNKDARDLVELISKRIRKMDFLIDAILKYSRISNKTQELLNIDVNRVVNETVELLEIPAQIKVKIIGKLPVIVADSVQLQQVFQNLIGNSIKFIGENKGIVEISHEDKGLEWEFLVRDNGPGIDAKHFERIFRIFQTLHPNEDELINSGVGLAIVKKIIELHDGEIKVKSEPNIFTEFIFTFPKIVE